MLTNDSTTSRERVAREEESSFDLSDESFNPISETDELNLEFSPIDEGPEAEPAEIDEHVDYSLFAEKPFTALKEHLSSWLESQKVPTELGKQILEDVLDSASPEREALVNRILIANEAQREQLTELIQSTDSEAGKADVFSQARGELIGRAYVYWKFSESDPRLVHELAQQFSGEKESRVPEGTVKSQILEAYEKIAIEQESVFTTLVTFEHKDMNEMAQTDYLRGMLEPYFSFCRLEPEGFLAGVSSSFATYRYTTPEVFEDLDDNFGPEDEEFLKGFYRDKLVNPDPEYPRLSNERIQFYVEEFKRDGSGKEFLEALDSYLTGNNVRLTDGDLLFLIDNFPTGSGISKYDGQRDLHKAIKSAGRGRFHRIKGWHESERENIDVSTLWKAFKATEGPVYDPERFRTVLNKASEVVDQSIRSGKSELRRAIKDTFFDEHRRISRLRGGA